MKSFLANPKNTFLIDGIGALVTSILLVAVVGSFPELFGLPSKIYFPLAAVAMTFSVYSFSCVFLVKEKWRNFLLIIATANVLYCIVTVTVLVVNRQTITALACLYFSIECVVILLLALYEFRRSANGKKR